MIDGVIYDLNTPTTIHQQLAFEISIRLREYIRQNKGLCMVLPSPAIYGFEDQLPVNIFAGKCQIDFSEIYSYIKFLEQKE